MPPFGPPFSFLLVSGMWRAGGRAAPRAASLSDAVDSSLKSVISVLSDSVWPLGRGRAATALALRSRARACLTLVGARCRYREIYMVASGSA